MQDIFFCAIFRNFDPKSWDAKKWKRYETLNYYYYYYYYYIIIRYFTDFEQVFTQ